MNEINDLSGECTDDFLHAQADVKRNKQVNENIETKSLGVDNGRVIRAFGQEAHVLVSSEQTGDAFCVLRFFIPPGNVTHRTFIVQPMKHS